MRQMQITRVDLSSLIMFAFKGGHLFDLDWLWQETIRDIRLDLDTFEKKRMSFISLQPILKQVMLMLKQLLNL